jgi:hypothetical protein
MKSNWKSLAPVTEVIITPWSKGRNIFQWENYVLLGVPAQCTVTRKTARMDLLTNINFIGLYVHLTACHKLATNLLSAWQKKLWHKTMGKAFSTDTECMQVKLQWWPSKTESLSIWMDRITSSISQVSNQSHIKFLQELHPDLNLKALAFLHRQIVNKLSTNYGQFPAQLTQVSLNFSSSITKEICTAEMDTLFTACKNCCYLKLISAKI